MLFTGQLGRGQWCQVCLNLWLISPCAQLQCLETWDWIRDNQRPSCDLLKLSIRHGNDCSPEWHLYMSVMPIAGQARLTLHPSWALPRLICPHFIFHITLQTHITQPMQSANLISWTFSYASTQNSIIRLGNFKELHVGVWAYENVQNGQRHPLDFWRLP